MTRDDAGWLDHPDTVRPTVLLLGGFMTAPPMYLPFVGRLMDRGATGAVVANVWTPDWLIAGTKGIGPICSRSARALRAAVQLSARVSERAPLLVVGHSAGGLTARLLTSEEPIDGRRFGARRWIGAIVTLGTPHRLAGGQGIGRRIRDVAAATADSVVPGAAFAPEIGYLAVASRAIPGDPRGRPRERVAHLMYRSIVGRAAVPGIEGDALVPVVAAGLDGARQVVLGRAVHGVRGPWYGSPDALDAWWPIALDAWRSALAYRAAAARMTESATAADAQDHRQV